MKVASWMLLAALSSSLQALPRNPFLLPVSPCEALLKRLDRWQLHGVFSPTGSAESIALMKFSGKRWQRVKEGFFLEPDVQVTMLLERQMRGTLTGVCEGRYYHWEIQGGINDKTYRGKRTDTDAPDGMGE
ncbi:Protein of uncharacterised function (DUF2531) [Cedecea neteri]|uniref:DUF2531 domain-containing protein n=1 Tax=Cedecea neteri TaxID=158822 RepID=A0A291DSG8_9ENTR|nr:HofP DNA utilization family protein [Cedecea neteri]ATF90727.1 DUF2531 domain-containing protein [Cedecea neteri]SQA99009.1 Protein of uncharacterised function (DUF2531) [Cedecea neteri]